MADTGGVAADQLRAFVERIERLEEEKKAISDDIKDVYGEAKAMGFDVKILRQVVRLRKQEPHEREEQEAILDLYMHALAWRRRWAATRNRPLQCRMDAMSGPARGRFRLWGRNTLIQTIPFKPSRPQAPEALRRCGRVRASDPCRQAGRHPAPGAERAGLRQGVARRGAWRRRRTDQHGCGW